MLLRPKALIQENQLDTWQEFLSYSQTYKETCSLIDLTIQRHNKAEWDCIIKKVNETRQKRIQETPR